MSGINIGDKVLITTNGWFYAPDGKQYNAVFGTLQAIKSDVETLGIRTNARSTNWYVQVGRVTIAGCQVYYAVRTDDVYLGDVTGWGDVGGKVETYNKPCLIYCAD